MDISVEKCTAVLGENGAFQWWPMDLCRLVAEFSTPGVRVALPWGITDADLSRAYGLFAYAPGQVCLGFHDDSLEIFPASPGKRERLVGLGGKLVLVSSDDSDLFVRTRGEELVVHIGPRDQADDVIAGVTLSQSTNWRRACSCPHNGEISLCCETVCLHVRPELEEAFYYSTGLGTYGEVVTAVVECVSLDWPTSASPPQTVTARWGSFGDGQGQFLHVSAITSSPDNGIVYILDDTLQRILAFRFGNETKTKTNADLPLPNQTPLFAWPTEGGMSLAMDPTTGDVFVGTNKGRVEAYSWCGEHLYRFLLPEGRDRFDPPNTRAQGGDVNIVAWVACGNQGEIYAMLQGGQDIVKLVR